MLNSISAFRLYVSNSSRLVVGKRLMSRSIMTHHIASHVCDTVSWNACKQVLVNSDVIVLELVYPNNVNCSPITHPEQNCIGKAVGDADVGSCDGDELGWNDVGTNDELAAIVFSVGSEDG